MAKDLLFDRPTNLETPTEFFFEFITGLTDGVWPVALTFIVFAVVYLNLSDYNPRKAYGAASFSSFIVVTFLVGLGVFESQALIVAILLVILAVVINGGGRS